MTNWTKNTPTEPGYYWYFVIKHNEQYIKPTLIEIIAGYEDEECVILHVRQEDGGHTMRNSDLDSFVRHWKYDTLLWQPVEAPAIPVDWEAAA